MGDFDALIERIENARTDAATTRLEALQAQPVGEERGVRLVQDDRYTPYKSLADCDTAAIRAVRLLEDAEDHHANCSECEGEGVPELCGNCFPFFDAARVERRLVMQSLSALTASPPVVEREAVLVERIETVPIVHPFSDEETPPIWRVRIGEQCADFDYEQAARNFADAILALTPVEGVGSSEARTEYGWLIERDGHGGLRYATPRSWTADHMKALRFARKVDAEEFAASRQDWSTDIRITEHAWD